MTVYGGKMLLPGVQIPLERAIWSLYPAAFASASTAYVQSDEPVLTYSDFTPPYLPAGTADIILNPISNETPPLTFCFVFNKSAWQHPHIPVALRKGIYHSAVDQIWHTPSCAGNSQGGYAHTVDLLA